MELRDFFELAANIAEYEELLRKESQRKKVSIGTYFQEVNFNMGIAKMATGGLFINLILIRTEGRADKKVEQNNNNNNDRMSTGFTHLMTAKYRDI